MVKKIISVVIIAAILITGVLVSQQVFIYSDEQEAKLKAVYKYYEEFGEEVDVCYFGSSPAYVGISPMVVWQEEGITSANVATYSQNAMLVYYQLKSLLKLHKPKAIVLELSSLFEDKKADNEKYERAYHRIAETLPDLSTKNELIKNIVADNEDQKAFDYWCSFYTNHHLWSKVRPSVFANFKACNRGGMIKTQEYKPLDIPEDYTPSESISSYSEEYYDKFFKLCKENDIKVYIVEFPKNNDVWTEKRTELWTQYCKDKKLNYLNLNSPEALAYMDIDPIKDFYDQGHMNAYGNFKVSQIIAKVLKKDFNLENHKNDPAYKTWENDYKTFAEEYKDYLAVTPDF